MHEFQKVPNTETEGYRMPLSNFQYRIPKPNGSFLKNTEDYRIPQKNTECPALDKTYGKPVLV